MLLSLHKILMPQKFKRLSQSFLEDPLQPCDPNDVSELHCQPTYIHDLRELYQSMSIILD